MAHVLTESELDLFHPLGRKWSGMVVVQSGKRRLRVEGEIPLTPFTCFVPLPDDVQLFDGQGKKLVPTGSKKFFISVGTEDPHIIVETWFLPMAPEEKTG